MRTSSISRTEEPPTMPIIRGTPPTAAQKQLIKAAESLGPDKSLATLDASARLVLASVVLVASVLTGFGLFADVATRLRSDPTVLALPIGLAIASAVLAIFALVPWVWSVDVDNLNRISMRFDRQIKIRGALVIVSMLLLLAAIGGAAYGAGRYVSTAGVGEPTVTLTRAITGDGPTVSGTVQLARAPTGARAEITVTSDDSREPILSSIQVVGSSGDVNLEVEVPKAAGSGNLTLTFVLTHRDARLIETTMELSEPN
jgi:hypothetical protein